MATFCCGVNCLEFDGNFDRMKALRLRKRTKSFAYIVRGKSADARAIVTDPKNRGPIKVENTLAVPQCSHVKKLAFTQKSECPIDCRARNGWITLFHHLAKVCEGKRFLGSDNRFDNNATATEISSETFKLWRHATA